MRVIKFGFCALFALNSMIGFSQGDEDGNKESHSGPMDRSSFTSKNEFMEKVKTLKVMAYRGDVQAMTSLGLLYSEGDTTEQNIPEATKWLNEAAEKASPKDWFQLGMIYKKTNSVKDSKKAAECFEKSAKGGYSAAFFEWGNMYMMGNEIPQNYSKAMEIFKQGSELEMPKCIYGQGYLYYKGFGCVQDYEKAVELFESASNLNSTQAKYMLALCYRNGYGVAIDAEKANFLLNKTAKYKYSVKELAEPEPENAHPRQIKTVSKPIPEIDNVISPDIPETFQKIKQKPFKNNSTGNYTGYLVDYDWSGQNILRKTAVVMSVNSDGKIMSGECKLDDANNYQLNAEIQEKSIVFQDSRIGIYDHYSKQKIKMFELEEARLQQLEYNGSEFIVGNLELFANKELEKYHPVYLVLEKSKK